MRIAIRFLILFALFASSSAACGPTVDLATGLELQVVDTGWFDAGIINGQNKLVPSVSFTVKNKSSERLSTLQVNAIFRHGADKDEWGSGLVTAAGSEGLPPGGSTSTLTLKSQNGYTGSDQSRQDMLENSHFVDAKVELFAKYGSTQWKRMTEHAIERKLITR
jgi:hypothetical protein